MTYKRKLIEVALPLEAINRESAREKSIRHGHPSTLHLWWSRKPLTTARAVLFASLVDDPGSCPSHWPGEQAHPQRVPWVQIPPPPPEPPLIGLPSSRVLVGCGEAERSLPQAAVRSPRTQSVSA